MSLDYGLDSQKNTIYSRIGKWSALSNNKTQYIILTHFFSIGIVFICIFACNDYVLTKAAMCILDNSIIKLCFFLKVRQDLQPTLLEDYAYY
jgi:hypothetical protein